MHISQIQNTHLHTGWCSTDAAAGGFCLTGSELGPSGEAEDESDDVEKREMHKYGCKQWKFAQCDASLSCSSYKSCGRCVSDPFCGWCSATSRCEEGTRAGPIAGLSEGCVNGCWASAPFMPDASARTIEALVSSASESMEAHQRHLASICESAKENATKHLMKVIAEERRVNSTLKDLIRTCAPCAGSWPNCDCEGHVPSTNNVDENYVPGSVYVKFDGDEAVKASVTGVGPPQNPH